MKKGWQSFTWEIPQQDDPSDVGGLATSVIWLLQATCRGHARMSRPIESPRMMTVWFDPAEPLTQPLGDYRAGEISTTERLIVRLIEILISHPTRKLNKDAGAIVAHLSEMSVDHKAELREALRTAIADERVFRANRSDHCEACSLGTCRHLAEGT